MLNMKSKFKPAGDQIKAIEKLVNGIENNVDSQVLLGVTGSGKTFTIANVLQQTQRPALILSHNKTLAAQLYAEFQSFFPKDNVEYFVSHFDYYRPEAYMPSSDTFIDKTSKSNMDLDSMRMSSLNRLLSDSNTIVVASVASIYGALNPQEYQSTFYEIKKGKVLNRQQFLKNLVARNYKRNNIDRIPGTFMAKGDNIEISPGWTNEYIYKIELFGDEIERIDQIQTVTRKFIKEINSFILFPADAYTTKKETIQKAIPKIQKELEIRLKELKKEGKLLEYQRLKDRVSQDIVQLEEFGICSGIENYARYMDEREPGQTPYTIFDYIPKETLVIIDESHIMIPQVKGMFKADFSRKKTLVEYGFRLPSAMDNRPLNFEEFKKIPNQKIYVSATPSEYEIDESHGVVVEQIIRPTGLVDPIIEIQTKQNQIENIFDRVKEQIKNKERTFIITTTIRIAEELTTYFQERKIKAAYIHNELKTFERSEILRKLRKGIYDIVIGINLLREGIDIPEVSLILVLDADIESFMRTSKSLIQIAGRAARNANGRVVFYADSISKSMKKAMKETTRRREIQIAYNKKNNIKPQTIIKDIPKPLLDIGDSEAKKIIKKGNKNRLARENMIIELREKMHKASKELDFERAAQMRDLIIELQEGVD
ncbi:MAG: excinuclease ABC subunit UvrB [Mycoplasma sp.]|nr:excinuclease ABC subunit UvrB [Mycoplasma sp.]